MRGGFEHEHSKRWEEEGFASREEFFRGLFANYFQPICGYFVNHGVRLEDALDLAQETFLHAYRGLEHFRHDASAKTWLFSIARNVWLSSLRNRAADKRDGVQVPLDDPNLALPIPRQQPAGGDGDSEAEPLEVVLQHERVEKLRAALAALPPQMRQCVMLRLYQGLKYREIGVLMRISAQTVKTHLFQAKRRLTVLLEEYATAIEL